MFCLLSVTYYLLIVFIVISVMCVIFGLTSSVSSFSFEYIQNYSAHAHAYTHATRASYTEDVSQPKNSFSPPFVMEGVTVGMWEFV